MLARYASMEMQKNQEVTTSQGAAYEALMLDLLERKLTDQLVILRRLELLEQKLEERLHVITIRKTSPESLFGHALVERSRIQELFPGSLSALYEGDLVLLVSSADGHVPVREDMQSLMLDFRDNNITAGVSNEFTNISELARYYLQSVKALEFG